MSPYPTPEDAARGDIPPAYAQALAVSHSPDGHHAVVLLSTNEEPAVEHYQVLCERTTDGWEPGIGTGGLGLGWTRTSPLSETDALGVTTLSAAAPPEVDAVIVRCGRIDQTVPVFNGLYLCAIWDVPESASGKWPEPIEFIRRS